MLPGAPCSRAAASLECKVARPSDWNRQSLSGLLHRPQAGLIPGGDFVSIRLWALAPLAMSLALGVHAQTAASAKPDAKADPKADEAAAAMERAKRQAAGPMRVILEASKGKRPAAEPAAAPPVSDSASVRTVASRSPLTPEITVRSVPAPQAAAPEPAPAPLVPAPAASPVSTQVTLSSESLRSPGMATVPGLERATAAAVPNLSAAQLTLPQLMDAKAKPKLVSRVDPELPQRLLDDLGRNAVVAVDLTIRANGTVASVGMVTAVPQRLQRAVTSALEQWRFEPLASDRVHRIELVFNGE